MGLRTRIFLSAAACFLFVPARRAAGAAILPGGVLDTVAQDILNSAARNKGFCVDLACGSGQLARKLAEDTGYYVHAFEVSDDLVDEARGNVASSALYATEFHIEKGSPAKLPYPDHFVDLIVRGDLFLDGLKGIDWSEIERVLAPGGVAYLGQSDQVTGSYTLTSAELNTQLTAAGVSNYTVITTNGVWAEITKDRPAGMGDWSHEMRQVRELNAANQIRGSSHNRGAVDDDVAKGPFTVAYFCGPVGGGGKGNTQTMSHGRYILRWGGILWENGQPDRVQAFNGYNGVFLWETVLTHNDGHSLVAVGDYIFVTEGDNGAAPVNYLTCLDAETGAQQWTKAPSDVKAGMAKWTLFASDYDGAGSRWVLVAGCCDETDGKNFDYLVALNAADGAELWNYTPTVEGEALVIGDGKVFVSDVGVSLTARDLNTGSEAWTKPGNNNSRLRYWPGQDWVIAGSTAYLAGDGAQARTGVSGNIIAGNNHLGGGLGRSTLSDGHSYYIANFWARDVTTQTSLGQYYSYGDTAHPKMLTPSDYPILGYVRCYGLTGSTHCVFTNYKGLVIGNVDSLADGTQQKWFYYDSLCRPDCDTNAIAGNGRVMCPTTGCPCDLNVKTSVAMAPMPADEYNAAVDGAAQLEQGPAYSDAITFNADPRAWPAFRHDSAHTGITDDTLTLPLAANWEAQLAGDLTPPVAADGRVFVASDNHRVYALDAGTGQVLWEYTTGGAIYRSPAYWEGRVYAGSMDGHVYCLRADTGELIWRFRGAPHARYFMMYARPVSVWPASGGAVVDDGKVNFYAGLTTGDRVFVYSLDAATGAVLWGNDRAGRAVEFMPTASVDGRTVAETGASPFGMNPWGVLAANDTTLFIPQGLRPPGGMDRSTGDIKWFSHRGDSQQRSNYQIQWKASALPKTAGGSTVVLGGGEYLFAGGYNWLALYGQEFKIYRQDNGRQLYQDDPALFSLSARDPTVGPNFGECTGDSWGFNGALSAGGANAPVLDENAGAAYPGGALYRTVWKFGIYDFGKVKQAQLQQITLDEAKVADLDDGAVVLTASRHVVGRTGQSYRVFTKGTATLEQSTNSSAAAGDRITDGLAVAGGDLIASTQNGYVVCFSTFAAGGTHAVSGTVTGDVDPAIRVAIDGPCRASLTINPDGTYAFTNLVDGTYTVTPVMAGFSFTPASRTVNVAGADVPGVDFVADSTVPPEVGFAVTASSQTEADVTVTLEVKLSMASADPITVDYAVTGGNATGGGVDYTLAAGTLTFAPTETTKLISVTIVEDSSQEPDETVEITLSSPSNATLGANAVHTLTILDDDTPPSVGFASTGSSQIEGDVSVDVEVSLSLTWTEVITVDYGVTGGTATGGGVDYALVSGTLTFSPGETTKQVAVTVVGDALEELDETVEITLSNPPVATLGANAVHTFTILDDDDDGLLNSWEMDYFGDLDEGPSGDPDGDGLVNMDEYDRGTDPTIADTDGDGIPDGDDRNPLEVPAPVHGRSGGCGAAGAAVAAALLLLLRRRER